MDYVVLARKLRPSRFEHLIGQDTLVQALKNAVRTGRIAHAFLFTGSRGVGKTSTARILTKAFNCENPADGEPCDACGNCIEIANNASPDVYEIDAASNRGIDNIRELRENTSYVPVKCTYKTYIIDEAHMLTKESFNALLKTLEEPPPHIKFILATTKPHDIPDTILSRCQRYDFLRVPVKMMTEFLTGVTGREGIEISAKALEAIARNALGGVRDALTALDQVISFAGNAPADDDVWRILGLTDNREVFTLLGAVLDKSLESALDAFYAVREKGHDVSVLLETLIETVKDFSLFHVLGESSAHFTGHPPDTLAFFKDSREKTTLDELQQLFYLWLEVEGQIKRSEFAQAAFEMGLAKACRVEPLVGVPELLAQVRRLIGEKQGASTGAPPRAGGTGPGGTGAGGASRFQRSRPSSGGREAEASRVENSAISRAGDAETWRAGDAETWRAGDAVAVGGGEGNRGESGESREEPRQQPQDRSAAGAGGEISPPPSNGGGEPHGAGDLPLVSSENSTGNSLTISEPPREELSLPEKTPPEEPSPDFDAAPPPEEPPPDFAPAPPPEEPSIPIRAPPPVEESREAAEFTGSSEPPREAAAPAPGDPPSDFADAPPPEEPPPDFAAEPPPQERAGPPPEENREDVKEGDPRPPQHGPPQHGPPQPGPPKHGPLEDALCDDSRWRALVEKAEGAGKLLASKLRRLEVVSIGDEAITAVPPDEASGLSSSDEAALRPILDALFSPAFHIRINDDKKERARFAHTIAGRNQLREEARVAGLESQAENDESVQRLLRFFPKGKVVGIALGEASSSGRNDRREDV